MLTSSHCQWPWSRWWHCRRRWNLRLQQLMSPRRISFVTVIQREVNVILREPFRCSPCKHSLEEVIPLRGFPPWQFEKIRDDLDSCLWPIDAGIPEYLSLSVGKDDVICRSTPLFWGLNCCSQGRTGAGSKACSPMNARSGSFGCPIYIYWYYIDYYNSI
jgi:hypothetical protein